MMLGGVMRNFEKGGYKTVQVGTAGWLIVQSAGTLGYNSWKPV